MPVNYNKISPFDSSFQVVRTNPKLTGNVKITVDSEKNLWLNSIEANEELSKDSYKKYAIDIKVGHEAHIYNFFNSGKTPSQIIYDLREQINLSDSGKKFEDQFDFSNYFSGAKYLASKFYSEKFSYFAPMYLDQQIPEYFVIFKLTGSANYSVSESKSKFPFNKKDFTYDTFKNSEIIKVIDMTERTKLGKYLRQILDNPSLPSSPLRVSFQKDQLTYFRGISVSSGTYTQIGEDLYSFYREAQPLLGFEEFITRGFERNQIIHPFLLNLEFLFDDETSEDFDINRYVGFYCNLIELDMLRLDLDKHADRRVTTNTPLFKRKYRETENIGLLQENTNGVDLFFEPADSNLTDLDDSNSVNKEVFFPVLRDKDDFLYLVKPGSIVRDPADASTSLKIVNTSIDLGKFFGPDEIFMQEKGAFVNVRGNSFTEVVFSDNLKHLDRFRVYHNNGTRADAFGVYDEFVGCLNYNLVPNTGDYYTYYDYDNGFGDQYYFNTGGTIEKMIDTVTRMLNAVRNRAFTAYSFGNRLFIKANSPGNNDSRLGLMFQFNNDSTYDSVRIFEVTGKNSLHDVKIDFRGGGPGFQVTTSAGHYEKIKSNQDRLLVKTKQGWSRILNVSNYSAIINENTAETRLSRSQALVQYDELISIQLEEGHTADINFGLFILKEYFKPRIGILSMFNIKDFDFDQVSSDYVKIPFIDLYKEFYVPAEEPLLMTNQKEYKSVGSGKFEINGNLYSTSSAVIIANIGDNLSYKVIEGDCFLVENENLVKLTQSLYDKNQELSNFEGFAAVKSSDALVDSTESSTFTYRDKFINGLLQTEYDFNNERYTKNYALKSKIIPYISKWSMLDGRDVRDNPYRLNTDIAFGTNNFSPDHFETVPSSDKMTHEWFYIESAFNYKNSPSLINQNKYYFDKQFNVDENDPLSALFIQEGFENFFTYTPTFNSEEVGPSQFRYSTIKKYNNTIDSTFFKGISFEFKEVSPLNTKLANGKPTFVENSSRFNDYKFSALLKVVKDDPTTDPVDTDPIKFTMIEHKTFKWITLVIELRINDSSSINPTFLSVLSNAKPLSIVTETQVPIKAANERYSSEVYNSLYGDYRLEFDEDEISNMTYAFLYYAKHKKFNSAQDSFATTKLGNKLDFSNTGIDNLLNDFSISRTNKDYFIELQDEITNFAKEAQFFFNSPSMQSKLLMKRTGDLEFIKDVKFNKVFTDSVSQITIEGLNLAAEYQVPSSSAGYWSKFINFQILGGKNYHENLFKYISFAFVKHAINSYNPLIKYVTYEYGEGTIAKYENQFYVEVEDPEFIEKTSLMSSEPEFLDLALSTTISGSDSKDNRVGYELFQNDLTAPFAMSRYSGNYEVMFRPVSCFKSTVELTNYDGTLKFANTNFNSAYIDLLEIKNFSHLKISNSSILSLANDSKYEAVYPLVGEVPIGTSPYFLLSSNWDYGFHQLYTDRTKAVPVSGTLRIGEDSSFLSKLVNLPDAIDLDQFDTTSIQLSLLNNIFDGKQLVYEENLQDVTGVINVVEVMINYFFNSRLKDNILSIFKDENGNPISQSTEFFGNMNADEYVKAYIRENLIKLYKITGLEFYQKPQRGVLSANAQVKGSNPNTVTFVNLNDSSRFNQKYTVNTNIEINKLSDLIIKFKIAKPIDTSLLVSPKIKIRLI